MSVCRAEVKGGYSRWLFFVPIEQSIDFKRHSVECLFWFRESGIGEMGIVYKTLGFASQLATVNVLVISSVSQLFYFLLFSVADEKANQHPFALF